MFRNVCYSSKEKGRKMQEHLSDNERKVLVVIQKGFPSGQTPYKDMAEYAGIEVDELLEVLKGWKEQGKLRRIGAILNHFKVGLPAGGMVVWKAEPGRVEEAGQILSGFQEVSHAYERRTYDNWPYNLYTMVHGSSDQQVEQVVERMSRASGVSDYRILSTVKELKKVPPTYIIKSES